MNPKRILARRNWRTLLVTLCVVSVGGGDAVALVSLQQSATPAQQPAAPAAAPAEYVYTPDQLDSLVAPIALYPDPLLAQTLAASTYPLEIVQLHQWLAKHSDEKEKKLAEKVAEQPWDPSIQAMAALPDVVKRLADDIQWTTELGNAFLAQEADVMQAVQRMRVKAQSTGNLKSTPEQVVKTEVVESRNDVVIEQANPQVVYVPSYDPVVVYGPAVYPYPPIYYPPWERMRLARPSRLASGSRWVRRGAAGGAGMPAGDTTISTSTTTTTSIGTRTSTAARVTSGGTNRNTAAALPTRIGRLRTGMAARRAATLWRTARRAGRVRGRVAPAFRRCWPALPVTAPAGGTAARDRASQAGAAARDRAGAASSSRAAGAGDRVGQRDVPRAMWKRIRVRRWFRQVQRFQRARTQQPRFVQHGLSGRGRLQSRRRRQPWRRRPWRRQPWRRASMNANEHDETEEYDR